ncbi:hypothetical protein BDN72DRAFT_773441, partial [Pluteus cervinus]
EAVKIRQHLKGLMEHYKIDFVFLRDERKLDINIRRALFCGPFMQVAHREGARGNYVTFKDNQVVVTRPSCGLPMDTLPEWVMFTEFILTTRPYIRVVSEVQPEW